MFLLTSRKALYKLLWTAGMLRTPMALFRTASRGGFITLVVAGAVCLWHFGVKGKRLYLIVVSGVAVIILLFTSVSHRQRISSL